VLEIELKTQTLSDLNNLFASFSYLAKTRFGENHKIPKDMLIYSNALWDLKSRVLDEADNIIKVVMDGTIMDNCMAQRKRMAELDTIVKKSDVYKYVMSASRVRARKLPRKWISDEEESMFKALQQLNSDIISDVQRWAESNHWATPVSESDSNKWKCLDHELRELYKLVVK
jgi:hypothetical protein